MSFHSSFASYMWPKEVEMPETDRNQREKRLRKRTLPWGSSEYQVHACYYSVWFPVFILASFQGPYMTIVTGKGSILDVINNNFQAAWIVNDSGP